MRYNPIYELSLIRSAARTAQLSASIFIFLCTATQSPAAPTPPNERTNSPSDATHAWPSILQAQLLIVAGTEYRLRVAAGPICKRTFAETGLIIDYIGSYNFSSQRVVRDATGMGELPTIIGTVKGSAAAQAGIMPGDAIVEINGILATQIIRESPDPRLIPEQLRNQLAQIAAGQSVDLTIERHGERLKTSLMPEQLCGAHFLLKSGSGSIAWSDGFTVVIGGKLMNSVETEDELALLAGHELAHVIYRDETARSIVERRHMEDRADLLGADLARCADYDVPSGLAFWHRFNAADWLRWMRDPTHRNVPERIRRMMAHMKLPQECPPDPVKVNATVKK